MTTAYVALGSFAAGWFGCFALWHRMEKRDTEQQMEHLDRMTVILGDKR